ncbi:MULTISPECIES: hypothetical protein [Micromonospora]|nr:MULTISPECIES: hypothetical protein [Micromonospora]NES13834.1 hypothetical protein [Micromonospora sp. PPF5-17B]NES37074.1 hypothetical protein [Micromonospora solifontis]NES58335.1 hypothetical protein [Micromonospora sp. PPF5-6]
MDDARPPGGPDVPPPVPPPPPVRPPPGYGPAYGPPPAYRPPPYPVPAPPPRRSRLPLLLGLGGTGMAVLLVCGLLAGLLWANSRPDDPASPGATDPGLVEQVAADSELTRAATTLLDSPATRYRGWFTDAAGSRYDVDARVTNDGSTVARLTAGGQSIQVVEIGERTFVKAGVAYWRSAGAPARDVAEYARRWVKVPAETFGFDLGDVLAPRQVAEFMAPGVGGEAAASVDEATSRRGPPRTVDGVAVVPVTAGRLTYYVTRDEPKRLVRMATGAPPAGGTVQHTRHDRHGGGFRLAAVRTGEVELALTLAQLTATESNQLFTELKAHLTDLRRAIDTEVKFSLNGSVTLAPCTTNGCTATLTLRNTVSSRSPYLSVRQVTAEVTVRMTLDGAPVATCPSTRTMKANGTVRVSCRAAYSIPPSRNPRTHTVRADATAIARALAEADIRQMAKDLADQITGNRNPPTRTGAEYFPKGRPPTLTARQQAARDRVDQLAKRACREVKQLPGEDATAWGSRVHRRLAQMLADEPRTSQLYSEVGYRAGGLSRRWYNPVRGISGWIKGTRVPDVVFGADRLRPELLLDLKTGSLGLEERWYNELVAQLPQRYKNVPVLAVRC